MDLPIRGEAVQTSQWYYVRERGSENILDCVSIRMKHFNSLETLERVLTVSQWTRPGHEVWFLFFAPDEWKTLRVDDIDDGLVSDEWAPFYQLYPAEQSA